MLRTFSLWMLAAFSVCLSPVALAEAQDSVIHLPLGWEHATVSTYSMPTESSYIEGFADFQFAGQLIGPASGKIPLPPNAFVGLKIEAVKGYETFISNLPKTGIHRLEIDGATFSGSLIGEIEKIKSLQQLTFSNCNGTFEDQASMNGLPNLKTLRCNYSDSDKTSHASVAIWAAKCTQLQYFSDGISLSLSEISRFANHEAPLFIRASLGEDAADILRALSKIPNLVALNLIIEKNAPDDFHVGLGQLSNLQLFNWNNGLLDKPCLESLTTMERLRKAHFQGKATVKDQFIENIPRLMNLESLSFNFPLTDYQASLMNEKLLEMVNITDVPTLTNVTSEQLNMLCERSKIRSLSIDGLAENASQGQLIELIDRNTGLSRIELSRIEFGTQLATAICNSKNLTSLDLRVPIFDGNEINKPEKLENLSSLHLKVGGEAQNLSKLSQLPKLDELSLKLAAVDPSEWSFIANCKSLRSITIFQGHVDDTFVPWLRANRNLRSIEVNPSTMRCFLTEFGIEQLSKCDHLESISIGGIVKPMTFARLATMPKLKRLAVYPGLPDGTKDNSKAKLEKSFPNLDSFYYRNKSGVVRGNDGVYRSVPREVGRDKLDDLEGKTLDSLLGDFIEPNLAKELQGKVVLVDFWGTWCGPCLSYNPELERLHNKFAGQGFAVLGIHSQKDAETANAYLEAHPKPWPNIIDGNGDLKKAFGVPSWPSIYIFGRDGKLKHAAPYRYGLDEPLMRLLNRG